MKTFNDRVRRKLLSDFITTFRQVVDTDEVTIENKKRLNKPLNALVDYYDEIFEAPETAALYLLVYLNQMDLTGLTKYGIHSLDNALLEPAIKNRLTYLHKPTVFADAVDEELTK